MKVSVCCITYNQSKFIVQAIESILSQNFNEDYELVIADDCSTDGTREILQSFKEKFPQKIKLILHERNIGVVKNFKSALDHCSGEYIAICEGDDYWIDKNKLNKQLHILESKPEYALSFHEAKLHFESGINNDFPDINKNTPETTTIENMIQGNYIHTPTCFFRNWLLAAGGFPKEFENLQIGDWALHLCTLRYGKAHFLKEEMAAYRISTNGTWSTKKWLLRVEYARYFLKCMRVFFKGQYLHEFNRSIGNYSRTLIKLYWKEKQVRKLLRGSVALFFDAMK